MEPMPTPTTPPSPLEPPTDTGRAARIGLWTLGLGLGGFLLWAAADRVSLKRRAQAGTLRTVPALPVSGANDLIAVVGGLALYGLTVMWAHALLFGVRPFGGGI